MPLSLFLLSIIFFPLTYDHSCYGRVISSPYDLTTVLTTPVLAIASGCHSISLQTAEVQLLCVVTLSRNDYSLRLLFCLIPAIFAYKAR